MHGSMYTKDGWALDDVVPAAAVLCQTVAREPTDPRAFPTVVLY